MRSSIILALLATVPAQVALARQPAPPPAVSAAHVAAALRNPLVQDGVAQAVAQLAGILLDTRVGPLATLADPRGAVADNDTVRDLVRRHDPAFEAHLRDRTRGAVAAAGTMASGALAEKAELDRTVRRLEAAVAPLLAYAGNGSAADRRGSARTRP